MAFESQRAAYRASLVPEWKPRGTYGLLAAMAVVFVLQRVTYGSFGDAAHSYLFVIAQDWPVRPWSLVTSTLAHGDFMHILFNGLMLFFFGPALERILGTQRFLILVGLAGAASGILQVLISPFMEEWLTGRYIERGALGISGSLMMIFGALVVLMPRQQILVYGIVPIPFWIAGIGYAVVDVLGAFTPNDQIGNFAHLAGMALGIVLGLRTKEDLRRRGLRLAYG